MIKLPREIHKAMQIIEGAGFPAYAAGDAVANCLLGEEPELWELLTVASVEQVETLFAEARRDEQDAAVLYTLLGECEFAITCGTEPEDELCRRGFTVCGMADNPARSFLDPTGGRKDLDARLVRTISEPKEYFQKNPLMILYGIALAARLDFDIEMDTFLAMKEASAGLENVKIESIRDGFGEILDSKTPARGLRFAVAANILPYVLGEDCYPPKSKNEIDQLNVLMEKFDLVRQGLEYRYPMLFLCFDEKKGERAIRRLHFDEATQNRFLTALRKTQELYFITQPYTFKKFLYQNGGDNYEYWENIVKQQRKVYDHPENRILSRHYMKKDFDAFKMAIYLEDLAVNRESLIEAGIPEKKADDILEKLLYIVHYKPRLNTRELLLSEAKRVARNPFYKFMKDVHFMK